MTRKFGKLSIAVAVVGAILIPSAFALAQDCHYHVVCVVKPHGSICVDLWLCF